MALNAERRDKRTDQLISPRAGSDTVALNACTAFGTASPKTAKQWHICLTLGGLKQCHPAWTIPKESIDRIADVDIRVQ
jgi:hypothetical protein